MTAWIRIAAQIGVLTVLFATVSLLSAWPQYNHISTGTAVIKLSITHAAAREAACRKRTPEELAKLPPNMRNPLECSRKRGVIYVELELDGRTIYGASLPPSGISGDGPARAYQRFVVPAGPHVIAVRMRDSGRSQGFDYSESGQIVLASAQNFVVDFRRDVGFVFR
jgi:hypothetical protein